MCKVIPASLLAPPATQTPEQLAQLKKMDQVRKAQAKEHLLKVQVALAKRSFGVGR